MIMSMPTTTRPQRRYDHRLRHLVQRIGDPHPAEQARGRVMIEAATTDFGSLEMVTSRISPNSSCGS